MVSRRLRPCGRGGAVGWKARSRGSHGVGRRGEWTVETDQCGMLRALGQDLGEPAQAEKRPRWPPVENKPGATFRVASICSERQRLYSNAAFLGRLCSHSGQSLAPTPQTSTHFTHVVAGTQTPTQTVETLVRSLVSSTLVSSLPHLDH